MTGTEVLTGRVTDRNGPWLSERLFRSASTGTHEIVGDRPPTCSPRCASSNAQGVDLVVTSGGLGPTADDLTAEVVG